MPPQIHADERARHRVALLIKRRYLRGETIREIAAESYMSYGTVRNLLLEVGTPLRGRGGPRAGRGLKPKGV